MLFQDVMKKARAESVTWKRELHGLLKAPGSVLSTMLKNLLGGKTNYCYLLSHTELSSDVVVISNWQGTFDVILIGHNIKNT